MAIKKRPVGRIANWKLYPEPGANEGDPSTIGIALPDGATDGAKYVFQADSNGGGTWTQMEVATTWSSDFLTGGN